MQSLEDTKELLGVLHSTERLSHESGLDITLIVLIGMASEETCGGIQKQGEPDYLLKDRMTRLGPAVGWGIEERQLRVR